MTVTVDSNVSVDSTTVNREGSKKMGMIPEFSNYNTDSLEDWLILFMAECDRALVTCGATPGKDYNYRDLMAWAIQLHAARQARFEHGESPK